MLQNPETLEFYLNFCRGLNYWDCFDHGEAWLYLEPYTNQANLRPLLLFLKQVMGIRQAMDEQFLAPDSIQGNGYELVEDLVLNAERRAKMERYDDAVGRLYRALELLAQVHLWRRYEIKTGEVDLSKLPDALRAQYAELKKARR
jgi:CRISPR-associated protein (TIGR02710 family)